MKRPKKGSRKLSRLGERLFQLFKSEPETAFSQKEIFKKLGKANYPQEEIFDALNDLYQQHLIAFKNNRFKLSPHQNNEGAATDGKSARSSTPDRSNPREQNDRRTDAKQYEGVVDMTANGSAYIIAEQSKRDIYVPSSRMRKALDGDRVLVRVTGKRGGGRLEGEIVKILHHSQTQFVGIVAVSKNFAFLIPNKKMGVDFFIPLDKLKGAQHGDKVMIKVVAWADGEKDKNPVAHVTAVLGQPGENNAEMLSILVDNGFSLDFSEATLAEAEQLNMHIDPAEIARRRDYRSVTTFTIDPFDAKDFDDALSMRRLDNGNWEIGIHIADVTHYVAVGSAMDTEAFQRATSVYLVDRVLPMFPEKLSNEVCSLRPNEDKLCFAAIFELTPDAKVVSEWFGRTAIHSQRRFNYTEAQHIIDSGTGDLAAELQLANELAKKLREQRTAAGSINFGSEEVKFVLDENGKPIEVVIKQLHDTNRLIEDYMLLANRRVAAYINRQKVPSVNRIHDVPDMEKLIDFKRLAAEFGYKMNLDTPDHISASLNQLLADVKGKPEQQILETLAIRSMAKAAYSPRADVGHYGLAFKDYAHFTSPIRRYPDVMLHRILQQCLDGTPQFGNIEALERQCEHTSMMERKAMQAERESTKYKQVEYLSSRIGEVFDGTISGVTNFGFFVEIKGNKCEGLVALDSLMDDQYSHEPHMHAIVGSQRGRRYQLGAPVRVKVVKTDLITRTIDMEVA